MQLLKQRLKQDSKQSFSYRRLDVTAAILIGAIGCLHRLAWSSYPPDVDPINFTLALHTYDLSADAPHPPGYPLFVFLGRLSAGMVGDQHAYQLVNLILLLGTGLCLYGLFRKINYPKLGLSAAALLLSHPLVWSATVIPESYISDAALACAIVTWSVIMRQRRWQLVIGSAAIFFLFGLFRPTSCLLLLPLAVGSVVLVRAEHRKAAGVLTALSGCFGTVLAYGVTIALAGGISVYSAATDRVMGNAVRSSSIFAGASLTAHGAMICKLIAWSLLLAAPAILGLGVYWLLRKRALFEKPYFANALKIGLLWLLPPYTFYALIYYLKPTYQLIYLPVFLIVLAWLIQEGLPQLSQALRWMLIGSIVLAQLLFFFFAPSTLPAPLYQLSRGYFNQQDAAWSQLVQGLQPLHQENTLLIWLDHPSLTPYALRLLNWPEPSAVSNPERNQLQYLLPSKMTWLPPSKQDSTISDQYQRVVLIYNDHGAATIQRVQLNHPEMRQVSHLLRLAGTPAP